MGLNGTSVLVITDSLDENLYLASRNLPHVLVVEPRYADPVSLVHFDQRADHQAGAGQSPGDAGMNQERLMTVLVAPIVSEKATMVAEKNDQVAFRVLQDATKDEIRAAVELLFKVEVDSVQVLNQKGKEKRFGRFNGRRRNVRKAYVNLKPGQEINFAEANVDADRQD